MLVGNINGSLYHRETQECTFTLYLKVCWVYSVLLHKKKQLLVQCAHFTVCPYSKGIVKNDLKHVLLLNIKHLFFHHSFYL